MADNKPTFSSAFTAAVQAQRPAPKKAKRVKKPKAAKPVHAKADKANRYAVEVKTTDRGYEAVLVSADNNEEAAAKALELHPVAETAILGITKVSPGSP